MQVIYGQKGLPVGSIDGEAIFRADGSQIGFIEDDYIYRISDGIFIGSIVNGVIYNGHGHAQGFTLSAKRSLPLPSPRLSSALKPRLTSSGRDVTNEKSQSIPYFLRETAPGHLTLRDGIFSQ